MIFREKPDLPPQIEALVLDTARQCGLDVIDVILNRQKNSLVLQIFLSSKERIVSMDDCEKYSKRLDQKIYLENEAFKPTRLEVASAGLNRVFRNIAEFDYFSGKRIKIKLTESAGGSYIRIGLLKGLLSENVLIAVESGGGQEEKIAIQNIKRAELFPELKF